MHLLHSQRLKAVRGTNARLGILAESLGPDSDDSDGEAHDRPQPETGNHRANGKQLTTNTHSKSTASSRSRKSSAPISRANTPVSPPQPTHNRPRRARKATDRGPFVSTRVRRSSFSRSRSPARSTGRASPKRGDVREITPRNPRCACVCVLFEAFLLFHQFVFSHDRHTTANKMIEAVYLQLTDSNRSSFCRSRPLSSTTCRLVSQTNQKYCCLNLLTAIKL